MPELTFTQLTPARRCSSISDGRPCRAFAIGGSQYCFNHDPANGEKRTAARRRGGRIAQAMKSSKLAKSLPDDLRSPADLMRVIEVIMRACLNGEVDYRMASTMSNLIRTQAGLLDSLAFDERLRAIEARQPRPEYSRAE